MKDFPILNDEIIILRKLELTDSDNYVEYVTNEKIAKQFNFSYTEETAKKRVEELVERYNQETKPFVWVIALKDTNEMVGIISIDTISYSNKRFSIALGLREKYRSNNYAYLAATLLLDYIFKNFDMHRVELACNTDNIASEKTIIKLGGIFEGIARESKFYDNSFKDRKLFSILKHEWLETHK